MRVEQDIDLHGVEVSVDGSRPSDLHNNAQLCVDHMHTGYYYVDRLVGSYKGA